MAIYKVLVAAALFYGANAHMRLANPTPFAGGNNSPLEADGSNYPCKIVGGNYPSGGSNQIAVGTDQTLSFQGSAVHGGGSCQVSITADEKPTKNSKFKVIHSIIGGCPAAVAGNLPENAGNTGGLGTFKYQIPKGVANGKYTLAWTWFNKVGNREMYMECSPIEVTGGSSDQGFMDRLPDMFIANIPQGGQCKVPDNKVIVFPNPGDSKETNGGGDDFAQAPAGCGASSGGSTGGSGNSGSGSGGSAPAPSAAPAPAPSSGSGSGSRGGSGGKGNPGGVFAPGASSAAPAASATSLVTVVQPTQAPSAPTAAPAAPAAPPAGNASGACSGSSVSCSNDGGVVCMPNNKWGLCDRGCAVPQLMAAGMACDGGVMKAAVNVAPGRARRHVFAHKKALVPGDF